MPDVYAICELLLACLRFYFCFKIFFSKIITSLFFLSLAVMTLIAIEKAPQFLSACISFIILLIFLRLSAGAGWEMQFSRWHAYLVYLRSGIRTPGSPKLGCVACPSFQQ